MNTQPWMDVDGTGPHPEGMVMIVQRLLNHQGADLTVDGEYGPLTRAAMMAAQRANDRAETGVCDAATWLFLTPRLRIGDRSEAVATMQELLPHYVSNDFYVFSAGLSPEVVADGVFGPRTEFCVKQYQGLWGLIPDGVVGAETWAHLQTRRVEVIQLPLVRVGARGLYAQMAQHLLRHQGAAIEADGIFGPASGEALRQWQLTQRIRYVGPTMGWLDWPGLLEDVSMGDRNEVVLALKLLLRRRGSKWLNGDAFDAETRAELDRIVGPSANLQRVWFTLFALELRAQ